MTDRICAVEGCPRLARARGWCPAHYERWRRNGSPTASRQRRPKVRPQCAINGCDQEARTRSWCPAHYERWLVHGHPAMPARPVGTWGCAVCRHPEWVEIEEAMRQAMVGPPRSGRYATIARQWGLPKDALYHHRTKHLDNEAHAEALARFEVGNVAYLRAKAVLG